MDNIRIGKVSAINYADGTARIVYPDRENAVTTELPLLAAEYQMPQIDDLVIVLHLPNGQEAGVILGQYWCQKRRPTEYGAGLYRKDLSRTQTAYIRYQDDTGIITLCGANGVQITGDLHVTGQITQDQD